MLAHSQRLRAIGDAGATLAVVRGRWASDAPVPPTFSVSDASGSEGFGVTFTITRSGTTTSNVTVNYATAYGTATSNDFTGRSGTLSFAMNETSKTVTVQTSTTRSVLALLSPVKSPPPREVYDEDRPVDLGLDVSRTSFEYSLGGH